MTCRPRHSSLTVGPAPSGPPLGTTVASNAIRDLSYDIQSVVFVASAGVEGGSNNTQDLNINGGAQHVHAIQSSRDETADMDLEPTDGHDTLGNNKDPWYKPHATGGHGYFNKRTESLHNAAAATLGLDGKINDGAASRPTPPTTASQMPNPVR